MPNGTEKGWAKIIVTGVTILIIGGWIAWVSTSIIDRAVEAGISQTKLEHIAEDVKKIARDVEFIKEFFK